MSEKVSDTSQTSRANLIKNPLLAASLSTLDLDDYPNKPLLLPAAPPVVPMPATLLLPPNVGRETKSLVTVGSSATDDIDNDNLDEINLNASAEDQQQQKPPLPPQSATTLATAFDGNANAPTTTESILSQAASSFSALPSVLSTFSKRIYAGSSNNNSLQQSREHTPPTTAGTADVAAKPDSFENSITQLDIQPPFIQQLAQGFEQQQQQPQQQQQHAQYQHYQQQTILLPQTTIAEFPAPPPLVNYSDGGNLFAAPPASTTIPHQPLQQLQPQPAVAYFTNTFVSNNNDPLNVQTPPLLAPPPAAPPAATIEPKFYAPTEVPQAPPPTAAAANTNTYRLTARKKLYAPIPGLANQTPYSAAPPIIDASSIAAPLSVAAQQQVSAEPYGYGQQPVLPEPQQEERPGLLSSLSSWARPSGVLQNLSGLVQSATGATPPATRPSDATSYQQDSFESSSQQNINFFNAPYGDVAPPTAYAPPTAFAPPQPQSYLYATPPATVPEVTSLSGPQSTPLTTPQPAAAFFQPPVSAAPAPLPLDTGGESSLTQPPPPPPSNTGCQTSFRLQKGTRLYKSPLAASETAPVYASPTLDGDAATAPPKVPTPVQSYFVPSDNSEPQSVQLFAAGAEEQDDEKFTSKPSEQVRLPDNLFETFSGSTVPLAPTAATPTSATNDFAPQQQLNAEAQEETNQNLFAAQIIDPVIPGEPEAEEFVSTSVDAPVTAEPLSTEALFLGASVTSELLPPPAAPTAAVPLIAPAANYFGQPQQTAPSEVAPTTNFFDQSPATPAFTSAAATPFAITPLAAPPTASQQQTPSGHLNPYRRDLHKKPAAAAVSAAAEQPPPSLANFFTPIDSGNSDFNFFTPTASTIPYPALNTPATTSEPTGTHFPALPPTPPTVTPLSTDILAPQSNNSTATIGFEQFIEATKTEPSVTHFSETSQVPPSVSTSQSIAETITNVQLAATTPIPIRTPAAIASVAPGNPSQFFDNFAAQQQSTEQASLAAVTEASQPLETATSRQEDQRIQNFFNNPPPKEYSNGAGDLNYDLVHNQTVSARPLTPASNLVEPPSSSCSEFSVLTNFSAPPIAIASAVEEQTTPACAEATPTPVAVQQPVFEGATEITPFTTKHYEELPEEILHELRLANMLNNTEDGASATAPVASVSYKPAVKHWFYKRAMGAKHVWTPFSHYDSALLETSLGTSDSEDGKLVAVEGGRYDVSIAQRIKTPVYWSGGPTEVRRCSWFYKAVDNKYVPYEEQTADLLEIEYKKAAESGVWHKKIILGMGEQVVFHGPTVIVHFQQQHNTDAWGGTTQTSTRPRVVKRDLDDFAIDQGESQRVDHLLFMVHGIGAACDLKMRSVEEVVDDFRSIAQQLVQSHYKNSTEMGLVGRVEVLPISWHSHLHSEEMGIDEKLKSITLESIPKLRSFTNDTLLDVLFYTSPTYCQKIMNTVATSMNTVYMHYRSRNPDFNGGVSLAGHSLGSLILFDLLCHQTPIKELEDQNMENPDQQFQTGTGNSNAIDELASKQVSYTMGPAGTGQPFIHYTQLVFQPKKFFALGSPIGMFVTIRGIDKLGLDFRLPTCAGFYNIFHPFDPVAYRIEALVNPEMSGARPVLIPHHKGRKRMHLELKETMTRVGADLKQRFFDTFKNTMDSVNFLGNLSSRTKKEAEETMEKEVDKVIEMQLQLERQREETERLAAQHASPTTSHTRLRTDSTTSTTFSDTEIVEVDFPLGKLNDSKRIDYVLQEAPLEFFNEYLFALSSHVCYWESEDTILFVMKEIYAGLGISTDSQVPQQNMTIERPNSRNSVSHTLLSPTH